MRSDRDRNDTPVRKERPPQDSADAAVARIEMTWSADGARPRFQQESPVLQPVPANLPDRLTRIRERVVSRAYTCDEVFATVARAILTRGDA